MADAVLAGDDDVVEHGLFIGLTHDVIVAGKDGIRHLIRNAGSRL